MKTTHSNKIVAKTTLLISIFLTIGVVQAQDVKDIRWKNESQVRDILGEPESVSVPVGTHATYVMWQYPDFTVAFADNSAFHLFKRNSLNKLDLEENR